MDTRGNKKVTASGTEPMSEETRKLQARAQDIHTYEQNVLDKEARVKAQEARIRQQIEEFEAEREKYEKVKASYNQVLEARENEISAREKEIEKKWSDTVDVTPLENLQQEPVFSQAYGNVPQNNYSNIAHSNTPLPKVSFREATESVPSFDGYNIPLAQFTRACRRARDIIPLSSERNLTKLLINKLRGRAYYAVEDEPCDSVTQLVDLLNVAFGDPKTIDQYRGELSTTFLQPREHVLDYISRVKDLRTNILDMERRLRGQVDHHFMTDIDDLTSRSFCDGLPLEYRLQMKADKHLSYTDAFATAKAIAKRQELDKQRYEGRYRNDRDMKPIGRPLAHSTPQRYNQNFRREDAPRSPASPSRNFAPINSGSYDRRSPPANGDHRRNDGDRRDSPNYTVNNENHCRYCKNPGHTIDQCRKRQYNNARKDAPGNADSPAGRPDATRADNSRKTRPVNPINTELNEEQESQC